MKSKWESSSSEDEELKVQKQPKKPKIASVKSPEISQPTNIPISGDSNKVISSSPTSNKFKGPKISPCRHINLFENLNKIEEGSYGVVFRARNKETGEIVAIKRLKLENERNGFPITSLREIYALLMTSHPNIVNVLEILSAPEQNGIFIVMEFVEHELKSLIADMPMSFLQSEIKTIMLQLLSATDCLHENWIVHRDLKTSNILMNNRGLIKVADFGMCRRFADPLGNMTDLVQTLWYRCPSLLLGAKTYSSKIDMWSIGCIFAEIVNHGTPLFPGTSEIDQLKRIFQFLGTPDEASWPGYNELPNVQKSQFLNLTESGLDLLTRLLCFDPESRISAKDALKHPYFKEDPPPKPSELFPSFPSKGSGEKRRINSPSAPPRASSDAVKEALGIHEKQSGFRLRF